MARIDFAAGLIRGLAELEDRLQQAPDEIAKDLLDSVLHDEPMPPWNTGHLRSAMAAYVGSRRVATAPYIGADPVGPYSAMEEAGMANPYHGGGDTETPQSLHAKKVGSVKDTITILSNAPHSEMMEEGIGGVEVYRNPGTGPRFIFTKLSRSGIHFVHAFKRVFEQW